MKQRSKTRTPPAVRRAVTAVWQGVPAVRRRTAALGLGLCILYLSIPRPPLLDGIGFSRIVTDRRGTLLRLTLSPDEKYRLYTPLEEYSAEMVEAFLLHEDRHFRHHPGFNPVSLVRAAWQTYAGAGNRRIGGSTITMQLARLRFGLYTRSPLGKLAQIARAIQIERHYTKDRILEAYLNLIPFSGNIEGSGAASLIYFGKPAGDLTLMEAFTLCVIPKNPSKNLPKIRLDRGPLFSARKRFFERWTAVHPESGNQAAFLTAPCAMQLPSLLPFEAPHFVNDVLSAHPGKDRLQTTLDLELQHLLERHARSHVSRKRETGIRNVAAVLLHYPSMEIRAALGSADFHSDAIQGQVNGTRARRSPGSTLKPFVYALAMDQGRIHPASLLKDTPHRFGAFNPENFDRDFAGPVSAQEALNRSRNIPAVMLARSLSEPDLHEFLVRAGITHLREKSHYGLGLVLGCAEISMEELATLYALLANGGVLKSVRKLVGQAVESEGPHLLSTEACWLVLHMLGENQRPGDRFRREWVRDPMRVPWKTGTSFAFRDAWTVGVIGPYILAVWAGNFDNESDPALVGLGAAAPLFFEVADSLRAREPDMEGPALWAGLLNLSQVDVCAVSGCPPKPCCPQSKKAWFIPGVSPIETCGIHREVYIEEESGLRVLGPIPGKTRAEVFEFWPTDLLKLFAAAGMPRRLPPPLHPSCWGENPPAGGLPPKITSPQSQVAYALRLEPTREEPIPFTAVTDADVRQLYWFVNDAFAGKIHPNQPLLWEAQPGNYTVRVLDDLGRMDACRLTVTMVR